MALLVKYRRENSGRHEIDIIYEIANALALVAGEIVAVSPDVLRPFFDREVASAQDTVRKREGWQS